jgi:hypothetical protein
VWKVGGDVCIHSNVVTTSVSEDAVNNSSDFQGFEGAGLLAAKAS